MAAETRADAVALRAAGGARGQAFDHALREEGRKAVIAAGLQATKLLLIDLADAFQTSAEARATRVAQALVLEPLLQEPIGFELKIPRRGRADLKVILGFKKAGDGYSVLAEQEKVIVAMGESATESARARAHHGVSQQMSLLIYSARSAFAVFAKEHGDYLRDLLGRDPPERVLANVLTGKYDIDREQMTLRVLDGERYGVHVSLEEEGAAPSEPGRT